MPRWYLLFERQIIKYKIEFNRRLDEDIKTALDFVARQSNEKLFAIENWSILPVLKAGSSPLCETIKYKSNLERVELNDF